jgi:hypothetical protein
MLLWNCGGRSGLFPQAGAGPPERGGWNVSFGLVFASGKWQVFESLPIKKRAFSFRTHS